MPDLSANLSEFLLDSHSKEMRSAVDDVFLSGNDYKYPVVPLVTKETRERIVREQYIGDLTGAMLAFRRDEDWDIDIESINNLDMKENELNALFKDLIQPLANKNMTAELGKLVMQTYEEDYRCLGGVALYENKPANSRFAALLIPGIYRKLNHLYDFVDDPKINEDSELGSTAFTAKLLTRLIENKQE